MFVMCTDAGVEAFEDDNLPRHFCRRCMQKKDSILDHVSRFRKVDSRHYHRRFQTANQFQNRFITVDTLVPEARFPRHQNNRILIFEHFPNNRLDKRNGYNNNPRSIKVEVLDKAKISVIRAIEPLAPVNRPVEVRMVSVSREVSSNVREESSVNVNRVELSNVRILELTQGGRKKYPANGVIVDLTSETDEEEIVEIEDEITIELEEKFSETSWAEVPETLQVPANRVKVPEPLQVPANRVQEPKPTEVPAYRSRRMPAPLQSPADRVEVPKPLQAPAISVQMPKAMDVPAPDAIDKPVIQVPEPRVVAQPRKRASRSEAVTQTKTSACESMTASEPKKQRVMVVVESLSMPQQTKLLKKAERQALIDEPKVVAQLRMREKACERLTASQPRKQQKVVADSQPKSQPAKPQSEREVEIDKPRKQRVKLEAESQSSPQHAKPESERQTHIPEPKLIAQPRKRASRVEASTQTEAPAYEPIAAFEPRKQQKEVAEFQPRLQPAKPIAESELEAEKVVERLRKRATRSEAVPQEPMAASESRKQRATLTQDFGQAETPKSKVVERPRKQAMRSEAVSQTEAPACEPIAATEPRKQQKVVVESQPRPLPAKPIAESEHGAQKDVPRNQRVKVGAEFQCRPQPAKPISKSENEAEKDQPKVVEQPRKRAIRSDAVLQGYIAASERRKQQKVVAESQPRPQPAKPISNSENEAVKDEPKVVEQPRKRAMRSDAVPQEHIAASERRKQQEVVAESQPRPQPAKPISKSENEAVKDEPKVVEQPRKRAMRSDAVPQEHIAASERRKQQEVVAASQPRPQPAKPISKSENEAVKDQPKVVEQPRKRAMRSDSVPQEHIAASERRKQQEVVAESQPRPQPAKPISKSENEAVKDEPKVVEQPRKRAMRSDAVPQEHIAASERRKQQEVVAESQPRPQPAKPISKSENEAVKDQPKVVEQPRKQAMRSDAVPQEHIAASERRKQQEVVAESQPRPQPAKPISKSENETVKDQPKVVEQPRKRAMRSDSVPQEHIAASERRKQQEVVAESQPRPQPAKPISKSENEAVKDEPKVVEQPRKRAMRSDAVPQEHIAASERRKQQEVVAESQPRPQPAKPISKSENEVVNDQPKVVEQPRKRAMRSDSVPREHIADSERRKQQEVVAESQPRPQPAKPISKSGNEAVKDEPKVVEQPRKRAMRSDAVPQEHIAASERRKQQEVVAESQPRPQPAKPISKSENEAVKDEPKVVEQPRKRAMRSDAVPQECIAASERRKQQEVVAESQPRPQPAKPISKSENEAVEDEAKVVERPRKRASRLEAVPHTQALTSEPMIASESGKQPKIAAESQPKPQPAKPMSAESEYKAQIEEPMKKSEAEAKDLERHFICEICKRKFASRLQLRCHKARHYPRVPCPDCLSCVRWRRAPGARRHAVVTAGDEGSSARNATPSKILCVG